MLRIYGMSVNKQICALIAIAIFTPILLSQVARPGPTVVIVEKIDDEFIGIVNSRRVDDLVEAFGQAADLSKFNSVIAIVSPEVSLTDLAHFELIANKAQVKSIRFFVSDRSSRFMREVKILTSQPFTTDPSKIK